MDRIIILTQIVVHKVFEYSPLSISDISCSLLLNDLIKKLFIRAIYDTIQNIIAV
ncbi:MAG: hypothetical protein JG782_3 [Anaerophaga sp.]|nr:hypothetical protein [Anaerophaga sp.]